MKRILCYGDSNTWGYQAVTGERFSEEIRWPCVLQKLLGEGYHVYENGMNARTTAFDDALYPYRNGIKEIIPALMVTEPLDAIVFMLGTNDTKHYLGVNGYTIAAGMERLIRKTQDYFVCQRQPVPKILLLAPIDIADDIEEKVTCREFDRTSIQKIRELRKWYPIVAENNGCQYMNAGNAASPSCEDGVHMLPEGHKALAQAVAKRIVNIV